MMQLQTPVSIRPFERTITYADQILLLGSCFSDEMASRFEQYYFRYTCNPLGTLYNPLSIAQAISLQPSDDLPLVEYNGLYHSILMHGSFSFAQREEALLACNAAIQRLQQSWQEASVVIITFGSAFVYTKDGEVVANCHKMPAAWFNRRLLSVEEIVECWSNIIAQSPKRQFIFCVSPIRHMKDGMHSNQLSKATLLLAVEELVQRHDNAVYFPSYEIMQDELRDYRFYAEDMLHPSIVAVDYIWQQFAETVMSAATKEEMRELHQLYQDRHHTILHPDSAPAQVFLRQLDERVKALSKRYPWIV